MLINGFQPVVFVCVCMWVRVGGGVGVKLNYIYDWLQFVVLGTCLARKSSSTVLIFLKG